MSSKGQVVIPASLRRQLRLKTGQPLSVRTGPRDELILRPVDREAQPMDEMLRRLRRAAQEIGRDLLAEFHERRRQEREREAKKHERWRH
jgi:AbrB family looped-hinge helix DNA binding protein